MEQFFQLTLKYLLAKKYGEFPKTHSLKILFELTKDDGLYIAARYFDVEYTRNVAERCLNLAKKFKELIEND